MRKKIIFVAFCLILFLILTTLSYGWGPNPKYDRLRGHPWDRMLSPKPDDNHNQDVILLAINPNFCLMFTFESKVKNFGDSDELRNRKSMCSMKRDSLNKNETRLKK